MEKLRFSKVEKSVVQNALDFQGPDAKPYGYLHWLVRPTQLVDIIYSEGEREVLVYNIFTAYNDGYKGDFEFDKTVRYGDLAQTVDDFLVFGDKINLGLQTSLNSRMKERTKDYEWNIPLIKINPCRNRTPRGGLLGFPGFFSIQGYDVRRIDKVIGIIKSTLVSKLLEPYR